MTFLEYCKVLSNIRASYTELRKSHVVAKICEMTCAHEDIYHVDIYVDKNNTEEFIRDFVNSMECVFNASKSCNLIVSNKNILLFEDGFSNPSMSLDHNFQIKERWDN